MKEFLLNTTVFGFSVYELLLWFLIYGVFGWVFESAVCSFSTKKLTNRGFLYGPFIPIYSFAITGMVLFISPIDKIPPYQMILSFLPKEHQVINIYYKYFIMILAGCILASVLEYIVSFLMEKLFNQRWWDYTEYMYNIKGRVCLSITVCWGLLSIAAIEFVHPYVGKMVTDHISHSIGIIVLFIGYGAILIDAVISAVVATKKKNETKEGSK